MPTLLQLNVTANWGSTGKIAEQIGACAISHDWKSYIAYGRYANPSKSELIKVGTKIDVYEHYVENVLFDNEGLSSRLPTYYFLRKLDVLNPDIIQIHNIHDHWINYKILFEWLRNKKKPVVWTQHDCWAFTGGCMHYSLNGCRKWEKECYSCEFHNGYISSKSNYQFLLRKKLFRGVDKLTIVPVSEWLNGEVLKSFLKDKNVCTILNGVDTHIFKPTLCSDIRQKYELGDNSFFLGVASAWSRRKGLDDYCKLASLLKPDERIVLVGITAEQAKLLPSNIIPIPRTQNQEELAKLYTEASVVLNLSYEETFGLTTIEGLSCGTPAVVYDCTASPELVSEDTGIIVNAGDVEGVYKAICAIINGDRTKYIKLCRERVLEKYNKDMCYEKYIDLYNGLINM